MPQITIGFFLLLASCVLTCHAAFAGDTVKLSIATRPAPAILFKDEQDNARPLDLKAYKLSAVHFWATWCTPCIAELPKVDAAAKIYADKGLHIVAISIDTNIDKVKQFYADHKITTLTPYLDMGNASFMAAGLQGLPDTLFIDATGQEIARAEGPLDWNSPAVKNFIEAHVK